MSRTVRIGGHIRGLLESAFLRNTMLVMSGTAVAQAIGFAVMPIVSRLFSPSDFGTAGSFYAISGVIAAGVTLDYTQAMMLPKEKDDAIGLFLLSCGFTILVTAGCLAACLLFPGTIQSLMKSSNVWMLLLLVTAVFVGGINQTCQAWCVRSKAFSVTSASQVIRSLTSAGTQVGLGYAKGGALALVSAAILGDVLASLSLVRVAIRDAGSLRRNIRWGSLWRLAKEYRDFPMYSGSMNVANALSQGLPVLLLTRFYGIAVAGAYAFAVRILQVPMGFVMGALRQVLFQKASETQHRGEALFPLYMKITVGLFVLALGPACILFIWAPELFAWVFGSKWTMAGEFARSLTLWMMFMFCNLPSVLFARIIRMQRKTFGFDLVLLLARAAVLVLGGMYLSASLTVILFAVVGAVMNLVFIAIIGIALVKQEDGNHGRDVLQPMAQGEA